VTGKPHLEQGMTLVTMALIPSDLGYKVPIHPVTTAITVL
jgi:hypothetical protein